MIYRSFRCFAMLLALLTAVIYTAACSPKDNGKAVFQEAAEKGYIINDSTDRGVMMNVDQLTEYYSKDEHIGALVLGEVTSVRYYYGWTGIAGSVAIAEIEIKDVYEGANSADLKKGDIVRAISFYGPVVCSNGKYDQRRELDIIGEMLGRKIESPWDFQEMEHFVIEIVPVEGCEYRMSTNNPEIVPFEEGKEYVYFLPKAYPDTKLLGTLYSVYAACPMDGTLEELSAKHGLYYYKDYIELAEDMAALFKAGQQAMNTAEPQETDGVEGCETPLYFDSEEQFLSFMSELRSGDPKRKLTVSSRQEEYDRVYSASNDYFFLSGLGEVYAPGTELPGTHLGYISASNNYVCYVYFNEAEEKVAYLMWHRSLPAEYAYPEGVERTEYNGVEYAIEELGPIEEEAYPGGYVISWVRDNKSFRAEFLVGFTVDDMLAFCEYRSVPIK